MRLLLAARESRVNRKRKNIDVDPIDSQDKAARPWAEAEGHEIVKTVADVVSSKTMPMKRRNLGAFLSDPTSLSQIDGILVAKMDRLSRGSDQDFTAIKSWADANRKVLVIASGPQYPARKGTADSVVWAVLEDQARNEWQSIHDRLTGQTQRLLEAGRWVGSVPLGLKLVNGVPVIDDETTAVLRGIVSMVGANSPLRVVSAWTREMGHYRAPSAIRQIVKEMDGYWAGEWSRSCEGVSYTWDTGPLVSRAEIVKARTSLASRHNGGTNGGGSVRFLAGRMFCGVCGTGHLVVHDLKKLRCRGADGRGCGAPRIPYYGVVELVNRALSALNAPVREWVPGADTTELAREVAGMEKLRLQLKDMGLGTTELDARLEEAGRRLESAESAGRWIESDQTIGDVYAGLDESQRAAWVRAHDVQVYAKRTGSVITVRVATDMGGMAAARSDRPGTAWVPDQTDESREHQRRTAVEGIARRQLAARGLDPDPATIDQIVSNVLAEFKR